MDEGDTCLSVALPASGQSTDKQRGLQENKSARANRFTLRYASRPWACAEQGKGLSPCAPGLLPFGLMSSSSTALKSPKASANFVLPCLNSTPIPRGPSSAPSLPPGICRQQPPTWPPCLPSTAQHILLKCPLRCCHPLLKNVNSSGKSRRSILEFPASGTVRNKCLCL